MKYLSLLMIGILGSQAALADRVKESKNWTEQWAVNDSPRLEISNIWGDVTITTGATGEIRVDISEVRSAPTQKLFDRSLEVLPLQIHAEDEFVSLTVGQRDGNWWHKDPCRGCQVDYDFVVTVPPGTQLDVSTVNDGKVEITGVQGKVSASNVNGPVTINGATDCEEVGSVNGAIRLQFDSAPGADCEIETINGDIALRVPEGAGLDVAMDLFNGRMVSELPVDPLAIPATVEESESDGRYQYHIKQPAGVRLAGGGPTFTISSLNGDIRIQNIK